VSGREAILGKLKRQLDGQALRDPDAVAERLSTHRQNLIPKRAQLEHRAQVDLFHAQIEGLAASVRRLKSAEEVPGALADYLRQQNLPLQVKTAPDPELEALPWDREPLLERSAGRAQDADAVSLTPVAAAVAETGTLMLTSTERTPTTLAFLPETHVVVVKASQVVGTYEEALGQARARFGEGQMPRSLNFVSGPSRTGDIEQKIELGAHGPRRLHVLLIEDEAADGAPA